MYSSTTGSVTVSVEPTYLRRESSPEQSLYVWSYKVRIENNGARQLQLKTRTWKITDAYGRVQEVHGKGVIGEQPVLKPGAVFEYTSGTPLPTPDGIMTGSYAMETDDGALLHVAIPAFSLHTPESAKRLH
ncbi:MAG: Co2+/Mg2+ efflux protein ApaG [Alphaproteobacteria bacterium]|nr:Co2+/Mg2+ efflux protein ApaG [Alphaproteobacteria bacterium]MDE2336649.1 Co2+/Mg2+ efflux protein ApaG [Alphaproteobacteria bacterium]